MEITWTAAGVISREILNPALERENVHTKPSAPCALPRATHAGNLSTMRVPADNVTSGQLALDRQMPYLEA
jgi:hypothetical protein